MGRGPLYGQAGFPGRSSERSLDARPHNHRSGPKGRSAGVRNVGCQAPVPRSLEGRRARRRVCRITLSTPSKNVVPPALTQGFDNPFDFLGLGSGDDQYRVWGGYHHEIVDADCGDQNTIAHEDVVL